MVEIDEMQQDIRKLRIDIENGTIKRDVGVARIASMQKELRGTISQVDSFVSSWGSAAGSSCSCSSPYSARLSPAMLAWPS